MLLTLVLPSMLSLPPATLAASPGLAALAQRSPPPLFVVAGTEAVLLAAAQLPPATPVAPLAARGAGLDVDSGAIARADPVALIAGRDDVLLGGRVDDLSDADAAAFIARLNNHFARDGLEFMAPRPDTWFVRLGGLAPPQTTSLAQVHGAIHAHLPRGAQAGQWKRWLSEMQMLLHDDPRNGARERAGQWAVTAIWIADAGPARVVSGNASTNWFAPTGRAGDLARGLAAPGPASVKEPPTNFAQLPSAADAVVILPELRAAADLDGTLSAWLLPALTALDHGVLDALTVVADGNRGTFVWTPRARAWWTRWRPWSRASTFVMPTVPDPQ